MGTSWAKVAVAGKDSESRITITTRHLRWSCRSVLTEARNQAGRNGERWDTRSVLICQEPFTVHLNKFI